MKKIEILESTEETMKPVQKSPEEEKKTYIVDLRFNTGFTPIIEGGEVRGCSTSIHFTRKGTLEEVKKAYTNALASLGLNPDSMDFTEETREIFKPKETDTKPSEFSPE